MLQPLSRKWLQLPQDVRDGVAHERAERGVVAVDGLDQTEAGHLLEVFLRLAGVAVTTGQAPGERDEPMHDLLAGAHVALLVTAQELLV